MHLSKRYLGALALSLGMFPVGQSVSAVNTAEQDASIDVLVSCLYLLSREQAADKESNAYRFILTKTWMVGTSVGISRPEVLDAWLDRVAVPIEEKIAAGEDPLELLADACIAGAAQEL